MTNEAMMISAVGGLAGAIGVLFKYYSDSIKQTSVQHEEELKRIISMTDERIKTEKESRQYVMENMQQFGQTLTDISIALNVGMDKTNEKITDISTRLEAIERRI